MELFTRHNLFVLLFVSCSTQVFAQKNLKQLLKQYNDNGVPYISVDELASSKTNVLLLDTREPKEYNVSHLKDAICVGYDYFDLEKFEKEHPNKDQEIVVYCSLGIRSETIGENLKDAGYTNIKNLYGGIFEWKNNNRDVFNSNKIVTDSVHTFSETWSKWLKRGIKVYPSNIRKE